MKTWECPVCGEVLDREDGSLNAHCAGSKLEGTAHERTPMSMAFEDHDALRERATALAEALVWVQDRYFAEDTHPKAVHARAVLADWDDWCTAHPQWRDDDEAQKLIDAING